MELKAVAIVRDFVQRPTIPESTVPQPSTMKTLMPHREAISTTKYGIACQML